MNGVHRAELMLLRYY